MNSSFNDDFIDQPYDSSLWARLKASIKLILILTCYAFGFVTSVQLGFWLVSVRNRDFVEIRNIFEWILDVYVQLNWKDPYIFNLLLDLLLLIMFAMQHTLMSKRILQGTRYWDLIHFTYQIDKPIYLFFTGFSLQTLQYYWKPIPLLLWTVDSLTEGSVFLYVTHALAWVVLYGTSLMLDLPEMIGLTQVAISSPTITAKSPNLQLLHIKQRHMGLIPLIVILLVFPYMTLDRLLLTLGSIYYMNRQWTSYTCYDYTRNMKECKKYST